LIDRIGVVPFVSSYDGKRDNLYCPQPSNAGMAHYRGNRKEQADPRFRELVSLSEAAREQVVTLTFIAEPDRLRRARELIGETGRQLAVNLFENWYSPGWYWLTIAHPSANKAAAVRALRARHALQGVRTIVFGDEINDVPLVRDADIGVAVANAIDEVRQAADLVIGSNTDDAVIDYIARAVSDGADESRHHRTNS
jgi:hydroxymethylpyrimidine pyrophosphatase-like HAD family hydrolase